MSDRDVVIGGLAEYLMSVDCGHPLRVGLDGPVASGKSTLARELAGAISARGRTAVHLDSDGFHHVREIRYRLGRASARGYYEGAYDFDALVERVLIPLGPLDPVDPVGSRRYATKVHDLPTDAVVADAFATAPRDAIVLFDCTFLQRGTLRGHWDEVIYLDVPREVAIARGAARDAAGLGGEASARQAYEDRYMAACDIYLDEERPAERASILLDHGDPQHPRILRMGGMPDAGA